MGKQRKGEPTRLNIFALRDLFKGAVETSNSMPPSSAPHIRRCVAAGLVEVAPDRKTLRLTDAGKAAIAAEATRSGDREEIWRQMAKRPDDRRSIEPGGRRVIRCIRDGAPSMVPLDELTEREIRIALGRPVR